MAGTPFGPGTVLARRFSLDDLLDEFDGARFWRATDQTLARSVAVHVLPTSDPRAGSLLTAARTSALVTDGHLLRVLDAAEEDGVVYVVNEWGTGRLLRPAARRGTAQPRAAPPGSSRRSPRRSRPRTATASRTAGCCRRT